MASPSCLQRGLHYLSQRAYVRPISIDTAKWEPTGCYPSASVLIAEPVTAGTDYFLAAVALVLGGVRMRPPRTTPRWLWGLGFLVAAAAAGAGGTFHSFGPVESPAVHSYLWSAVLVLIGAAAGFMAAAAVATPWHDLRWPHVLAGLVISAMAIVLQHTGLAFGPVHHNALFHLLEAAALWFFFRAAA